MTSETQPIYKAIRMNPKHGLDEALRFGLSLAFDNVEIKKREELTFDDLTVTTGHTSFKINEIDFSTYFSRNIPLKIPIVGAAMDTVTEDKLAIELSKNGGIGIIHRKMSPDREAHQVRRVKTYLNGLIEYPAWVKSHQTLAQIRNKFGQDGELRFHSFPVLDEASQLVGLLGEPCFKFGKEEQTAGDVMHYIVMRTGTKETTIQEAYSIMKEEGRDALPLTDQGELVGMYVFKDVEEIVTGSRNKHNIDIRGQLRVGAAVGVLEGAYERVEKLVQANVDVVVIDQAHGDVEIVYETLRQIKSQHPSLDVVVGNISNSSNGDAIKRMVDAGADGIKVGEGSGSSCTTRIVTGTGRPQPSAIYDCARYAQEYDIPIIADGGSRHSGDITKAIVAGADSIMLGGMLAGTDEAPGDIIDYKGRQFKVFRGMGSEGAMQKNGDSRGYIHEGGELVTEGIEGRVPYKGPLSKKLDLYVGGLRKGMFNAGSRTIQDLKREGDFDIVTLAAQEESHPHDVIITKDAPNYATTPEQNGLK